MSFTGFDPAAVALLQHLPTWSPDEYAAHKQLLTEGLVRPGAALIADVAADLDADLTVVPRSSVSPLHRDLRFAAPDTARFKDHLLLTTWEGADKSASPVLWIRIDAERVGVASGIGFTSAVRDRWRAAIAGDGGAELAVELERLERLGSDLEVAGEQLQRIPKPYPADHPRADLLRRTGFQVRTIEPLPDSIGSAAFVDWCVARLDRLLPIHRWLRRHLIGT